ncbi:mitochondrial carrier domain-containing protein [Dipodascopsis tothii]|uniref:mitochondrial carrier domain-containing protein n=1 Tax=Dipodascopsis tothii TaxID=44089 RepID=UPI0034CD2A84
MGDIAIDSSVARKAKDTAAGFVGGAVQVLIGQPFDLIKVRMQTGGASGSLLGAVRSVVRTEGVGAFYKGTASPLLGVGACVSVQFYAFHEARRALLRGRSGELSMGQFYVAGAVAGVANAPIAGPVEQVRILLQAQTDGRYAGPRDVVRRLYAAGGVRALFRGQAVTLLREAQAYGLWFVTFEALMGRLAGWHGRRDAVPTWQVAACGAAAGEVLWLGSYPLDVIKSRVQSDGIGAEQRYRSARHAAAVLYREAGLAGFWRGLVPTLLRATPCSAGTFATVELTMRLLG